jgi:hypothetical protein
MATSDLDKISLDADQLSAQINSVTGLPGTFDLSRYQKFLPSIGVGTMFMLLVIILMYYLVFSSLGRLHSEGIETVTNRKSTSLSILETIIWAFFILLLLLNGVKYFYNIDVNAGIKKLFSGKPLLEVKVAQRKLKPPTKPSPVKRDRGMGMQQVYHIPGNEYTYDDAKLVCKAFGGRLANYDEVEHAYKKGAEWCSYGWSSKQQALFPTQKSTWRELQEIEGHENDCGRQGINGGYIDNKNVRFGVNCYGRKPNMRDIERAKMTKGSKFPVSEADRAEEEKLKKWKKKIENIVIAPFNNNKWSSVI